MKAIVVPGVTDLNKGDQALVWESVRLIEDTGIFENISILTNGDTLDEKKQLCSQSEEKGFKFVDNILKHPRRGKHSQNNFLYDKFSGFIWQVFNALRDFISTYFLLLISNQSALIKLFFPRTIYQTIQSFRSCDTVFVKGGGFIHAYGEKTAPYLMWYFLFYVRLAQKLGKKVIFLPNSYGPFDGLTVKYQVRSVFCKLNLIYAREYVSATSLSNLLNKKIPIGMDLGFFLQKGNQEKALEILSKYHLSSNDKIVGITIRPWRFPGSDNPEKLYVNYIISVKETLVHILNKGYKIALCNQSLGPNSHEDDRNAIKDILKLLPDNDNVVWINENLTCEQLKSIYSNFYFFIGTRFHSIIFALTSLVPSIAIGYGGNKARGIMADFNMDEYVIQIHDVNPIKLIEMFNAAITNYDNIRNKLKESINLIAECRNKLINDIKNSVLNES